jgi:predicted nucleic acid-binding Zn finger protein
MFTLQIQGSGTTSYTVKKGQDGVVYCSCPAWRFQKVAAAHRSCKHIVKAVAILQGQLAAV